MRVICTRFEVAFKPVGCLSARHCLGFVSLLLFAAVLPLKANAGESVDASFEAGNSAYRDGAFRQAAEHYLSVLASGRQSAALHYNLGNAYYRLGEYGPAILHYEKSLALYPGDADTRANLMLARKAAEVPPPPGHWLDPLIETIGVNTYAWMLAIAFWCVIALWILPPLYGWKSPLRGALLVVFLAVGILSILALYRAYPLANNGVVLHPDTPLKVAPTTASPSISYLQPGTIAAWRESRGNHHLIETKDGRLGWVEAGNFSRIRN